MTAQQRGKTVRALMTEASDMELGALVREYIEESEHGSWDGFESHHMIGVNALIADLYLYWTHGRRSLEVPDASAY